MRSTSLRRAKEATAERLVRARDRRRSRSPAARARSRSTTTSSRPRATRRRSRRCKPAFAKDGTITAANASSISDGAAALVLTRQSVADKLGLKPVARIVGHAAHAHEPAKFTTAPCRRDAEGAREGRLERRRRRPVRGQRGLRLRRDDRDARPRHPARQDQRQRRRHRARPPDRRLRRADLDDPARRARRTAAASAASRRCASAAARRRRWRWSWFKPSPIDSLTSFPRIGLAFDLEQRAEREAVDADRASRGQRSVRSGSDRPC